MLKSILNLENVQVLDKQEQVNLVGGGNYCCFQYSNCEDLCHHH